MYCADMHDEVHEANFTYLLLAQEMIRQDKKAAMFCLGLTQQAAEQVAQVNPEHLSSQLLQPYPATLYS